MIHGKALPLLALAFILGTGLWLRACGLENMEFKADEAVAIELASGIPEGRFPATGLMSSVGLPNPPLFVYILSIPALLTSSPIGAGLFIALCGALSVFIAYRIGTILMGRSTGLTAAALMAVSPWAVLYSRKIWAQDLLQLLASLEMVGILRMDDRGPGSRATSFAVPVIALFAAQIHMSGVALVLILALVLLLRIRRPRWMAFIAGSLLGAAPLVPYILQLRKSGLMESWRSGMASRGGPGLSLLPDRIVGSIVKVLETGAYGGLDYLLGPMAQGFRQGLFAASFTNVLFIAVIAGGLGFLIFHAVKIRVDETTEVRGDHKAWLVLLLWIAVPVVMISLLPVRILGFYFIVTFPAPFVLAGLAIAAGAGRIARLIGREVDNSRTKKVIAFVVAGFIFLYGLHVTSSFQALIEKRGGGSGDYGTAYTHKLDVAAALAELVGSCGSVVVTEGPQGEFPLGREYGTLFDLTGMRYAPSKFEPLACAREYRLVDHMKVPEGSYAIPGVKLKTFGPLALYAIETE